MFLIRIEPEVKSATVETVSTAETFKEAEDNFLHANNETEEKAGIRKCFELAETMGEVSIICEDIFPHLYPIDSFEATLAMRAMAEMFIKEGETVL